MAQFTVCVKDSNILITSEEVNGPFISCNILSKEDFSAFSLTGLQNCLFCFFQVQVQVGKSFTSTRLMEDGWLSNYGMIALAFQALCFDQEFGLKREKFLEAILKLSSLGVIKETSESSSKDNGQDAKHQSDESFDEITGADEKKLKQHISEFNETKAPTLLCDQCKQQFALLKDLNHHIKSCSMINDEILDYSIDAGDICGDEESEIDESCQLVIDLETHDEETLNNPKLLSCDICETQFVSLSELKEHNKSPKCKQNDRKDVGPFICDKCGKVYTQSAGLKLHVSIVHLMEKNFQCDVCKKCFGRSDSLTKHMRSHTNERSYICEFCSLAFNQSSHLIKHRRTKHLDLNRESHKHVCEICSGRFYSKGELEKHNRITHEGIKDFICLICQHKFGGRAMCRRHVKKVHRIDLPVLGDHFDNTSSIKNEKPVD